MKTGSIRGSSSLVPIATPAKPGNSTLEKIRHGLNLLRPEDEKRFNNTLTQSKGDTLVIIHGHSSDLSGMGEQYPDETKDETGNTIQRKYNFVPTDEILNRYNDPNKFAAVVLHGCNVEKGSVEAKRVPVFYPTSGVKSLENPGFLWNTPSGFSPPKHS